MNMSRSGSNLVAEMIQTHPQPSPLEAGTLAQVIGTLSECAMICMICADACLGEEHVQELAPCIRLDLDCADICRTTAGMLARLAKADRSVLRAQLQACQTACSRCADECEQHAEMHEHCRVCAESCRQCEQVCRDILNSL